MKRFQRVLVGISLTADGRVTTGSRRAALQAQWLGEKTGASLTFLSSTWSDDQGAPPADVKGTAAGSDAVEELADEYAKSGLEVEFVMTAEPPWIEMIRRCLRGQNDLVIVARRNEPGLGALGSVARRLMRKCPAPVWVVKPDAELLHRSVLAATDLSPVGSQAVEFAAWIVRTFNGARGHGCKLHVLHAWQTPLSVQMTSDLAGHEQDESKLQAQAEKEVAASVEALAADLDVDVHVGRDAPSRAILEGVERLGADLLVMGTLSRSGVAGLLVGNTAEKLLDRVGCAVLALKPEDFVSPVELH